MSEALKCFSFLQDNAPTWMEQVDVLERTVKERKSEVARIPVPVSKHKIRRSGSNESIRDGANLVGTDAAEGCSEDGHMEVASAPQDIDMPLAQESRQQPPSPQRKRKTSSILSNRTAPNKYRSGNMIVVYYDSTVQEAFNNLVLNISTGRNYLRKAKVAARMAALATFGSNTNQKAPYDSTPPALPNFNSPRGFPIRPDPLANRVGSASSSPPHDPLVAADKALETAQLHCEKGAHQFLRDGECSQQTSGAKAAFLDLLLLAREQTKKLQAQEKEEAERRRKEREAQEVEAAAKAAMSPPPTAGLDGKPTAMATDSPIEADDDDESEDDFGEPDLNSILPPFRMMART